MTEITKTLSLVCHVEFFKVRHADNLILISGPSVTVTVTMMLLCYCVRVLCGAVRSLKIITQYVFCTLKHIQTIQSRIY